MVKPSAAISTDATSPVKAIVADDGAVIGIANYVLHESTSALTVVCHLQDLFVDQSQRQAGAARLLIEWLLSEMTASGWSRL